MRRYTLMLFCLLFGTTRPNSSFAQTLHTIDLKQLEGYYQSRVDTNSYLHFSVAGEQLRLNQLWDDRSFLFDHQSGLAFTTKINPNFTLSFVKDKNQQVNSAIVFGKDMWDKKMHYKPLPTIVLSAQESEQIRKKLKSKLEAYIAVVNSNSPAQMSSFIKSEAKLKPTYQLIQQLYKSSGGLTFDQEILFQPTKGIAVYLLKGNVLDNFFELKLTTNQAGEMVGMDVQEVRVPESPLKRVNSEIELVKSLASTASALNEAKMFSGTLLLAKDDQILFEYACGEAIIGQKPNTMHTLFNIGSINKMFTATAVMQLIESGKLQLNDPIVKYIDTSWLPKAITEKVTIHHLLSHSSGLGDFFSEKYDRAAGSIQKLEELKPFIKGDQLAFEPGSDWAYSNSGMILLGVIIEKVAGEDYFSYVKKHIYIPSKMVYTDVYSIKNAPSNLAYGYFPLADGTYQDNHKSGGIWTTSAGGGYATARDLYQFSLALDHDKLVNESSKALLFKDHLNKGYGYGFQLKDSALGKVIGHSGGAPGVNAVYYSLPKSGYHIIVLSNYDRSAQRVADYILGLIPKN